MTLSRPIGRVPRPPMKRSMGSRLRLSSWTSRPRGSTRNVTASSRSRRPCSRGQRSHHRFQTLVDPGRSLPHEIVKLTGITDDDLDGRPLREKAVRDLVEFVDGRDVVAHNVGFDRSFLTRVAGRRPFSGAGSTRCRPRSSRFPGSRAIVCVIWPRRSVRARLRTGRPTTSRRSRLCGGSSWRASTRSPMGSRPASPMLAPEADWTLRPLIAHIAAARPASAHDTKDLRRNRVSIEKGDALADAEDSSAPVRPSTRSSPSSRRPGLRARCTTDTSAVPSRPRWPTAVTEAFRDSTHLAVEAGTGVGKSLAYLVPAARFAMRNNVSVGVATKTNSLMDQLVYAELPALCEVLGEELRYVSLKGYDHYPCLRKLDRYAAELDSGDERRWSCLRRCSHGSDRARGVIWTASTSTGVATSAARSRPRQQTALTSGVASIPTSATCTVSAARRAPPTSLRPTTHCSFATSLPMAASCRPSGTGSSTRPMGQRTRPATSSRSRATRSSSMCCSER